MSSTNEAHSEQGAWRAVAPGWQQLYGDFDRLGVSVEWHDFRTKRALDWGRSFHPHSLEFCLNLEGRGAVGANANARSDYLPGNSGYYAIADEPLPASRQAHDHHQFVTLEFSRAHLQKQFVQNEADLEPEIRRVIFEDKRERGCAGAADVDPTTQRGRESGRAARGESGANSLVSKQGARAHGAFSFRAERSGILLHAAEARGARAGRAREGIARARSGQSAHARNARAGSRLQSVLSEPDFFARSRPDHSAISAQPAHGTRGRTVAQRPLQRDRGRD